MRRKYSWNPDGRHDVESFAIIAGFGGAIFLVQSLFRIGAKIWGG